MFTLHLVDYDRIFVAIRKMHPDGGAVKALRQK